MYKIDFYSYLLYLKVRQDERGRDAEVVDSKLEFRKIKIKTLTENKNMAQIAADIVDKCKYIHPSRVEEIEQLLVIIRSNNIFLICYLLQCFP